MSTRAAATAVATVALVGGIALAALVAAPSVGLVVQQAADRLVPAGVPTNPPTPMPVP